MTTIDFSESTENYLEVILALEEANKVARAKDIADRLGIVRGSVTNALKSLSEKGLIHYEPYSYVTLTRKGKRIASEVARRHAVLHDFLLNVLRLDPETAETAACRMEHAVDKQIVDRLVRFLEYMHQCPRIGEDWIESFGTYCALGENEKPECERCVEELCEKESWEPSNNK